ncbi:MAG: RluA family pseudouridine synthase [Clostridia bacterium]|nr:RluA family pseudouridine synthase [Clostridia bacterium]
MEIKSVIAETGGERIDSFLAEELPYSRSKIKKLIDDGKITVLGKKVKAKYEVKVGDVINIEEAEPELLDLEPINEPIDIVYQDSDVAVINKPQGLTVHAGNGVKGYTLVNLLLYHLDSLSGINGVIRPGIVHRIDKDTSGLLVVAKNDTAHVSLANQIAEKTCYRTYVALLEGVLKNDEGVIETYIGRSDSNRTMMAVKNSGRIAITNYKVLKRFENYTYCEFKLQTGRTHQIRVHAKHIGHPIVGDPVYGYKNQKFNLNGQLLHAISLEFTHPTLLKRMKFNAPIPEYFQNVLTKLKK